MSKSYIIIIILDIVAKSIQPLSLGQTGIYSLLKGYTDVPDFYDSRLLI